MIARACPTCGHRGRYQTQALADFHFARHSCATNLERKAKAARREQQLASHGDERPCTCKNVQHQHGDRVRYIIDKCRCHACKVSQRVYEQNRRRDRAYGRTNRVDATPVREHLQQLTAAGMGLKRIAAVSGVSYSACGTIIYGRGSTDPRDRRPVSKTVEKSTADRLLAVRLDLAAGAIIHSPGAMRRLQALVAIGWSQCKIARELGLQNVHLGNLIHGHRQPTRKTAEAITALYDRWWNQQPPQANQRDRIAYSRSLRYAEQHRWARPLDWDDEQIDDPVAHPYVAAPDDLEQIDEVLVQRALDGTQVRGTDAERIEITRRWKAAGRSLAELERLQGWNVHRYARRAA